MRFGLCVSLSLSEENALLFMCAGSSYSVQHIHHTGTKHVLNQDTFICQRSHNADHITLTRRTVNHKADIK